MMNSQGQGPPIASFAFAVGEKTPEQRAINAQINRFERTREPFLKDAILEALHDFDGQGHSHPKWIRPVMWANAKAAFGEFTEAIAYELEGETYAAKLVETCPVEQLTHAKQLLARSKNNLSDHYRRMGQPARAVEYGLEAYKLWPENDGIIVNVALALYRNGQLYEANAIIGKLACASNLADPHNVLKAHALFEDELQEMRDLPNVASLLNRNVGKA